MKGKITENKFLNLQITAIAQCVECYDEQCWRQKDWSGEGFQDFDINEFQELAYGIFLRKGWKLINEDWLCPLCAKASETFV